MCKVICTAKCHRAAAASQTQNIIWRSTLFAQRHWCELEGEKNCRAAAKTKKAYAVTAKKN